MNFDEQEARRQDVLRNVMPSAKPYFEILMARLDFATLKAEIPNRDILYETALLRWISSVQVQQCQNGFNGMTLNEDPVLSMVLNATSPSCHHAIRQHFNAGDYNKLEPIIANLHPNIQDAVFGWSRNILRRAGVQTPNNPRLPTHLNAVNNANNAHGPMSAVDNGVRTAVSRKPPISSKRRYEEVSLWASIDMSGYNALNHNATIHQAEKQHDCWFHLQAGNAHQLARYRVLADTKEAVLILSEFAIQIMSTTQSEIWHVNDHDLRAYIRKLDLAEMVSIQQKYGVFISSDGAEIRGWAKRSSAECHTELNNSYRASINLPPSAPYAGSSHGNNRGRIIGRGWAGNNNYGNRAAPQVPPQFEQNDKLKELLKNIDNYPEEMNILLLGETGSGKSTLINGIVNYLKHGAIENAMKEGVEVAIPSKFSLSGSDKESVEICCNPTIFLTDEDVTNEADDKTQSCTQDPKAYVFRFSVDGKNKLIRFIDTPGIMDTDGAVKDEVNFDKILKHITHYEELHAICVVMNSNKAKLTTTFKYCIDELLVHLHQDASRSLLFCFTNCKDTFDSAGDSVTTLRKHLKDLEEERDVRITLSPKQQYYFDNGCFRYLCAKQKDWAFKPHDFESNRNSWNMSAKELFRMLDRVSHMEPHSVRKTLSLNNSRSLLMRLSRPLAEVTRMLVYNSGHLDTEKTKLNGLIASHEGLSQRKVYKKMCYVTQQLDYPMTVCVHQKCVTYVKDEDGRVRVDYVKKCHSRCSLRGVGAETFPNMALLRCRAMNGGENCTECGCSWQSHMHIRYLLTPCMKEIENEDVKRSIANNESEQVIARQISMALEKEVRKAKETVDIIKNTASEFAMFLKKNALLPYGDSYLDYIDFLINEEKGKVQFGGEYRKCLDDLEGFKRQYREQVKLLQEATVDDPSKVLTVSQVDKRIKELMSLDSCKEYLKEVQELVLLSLTKDITENDRVVPLEGSWLVRSLQ